MTQVQQPETALLASVPVEHPAEPFARAVAESYAPIMTEVLAELTAATLAWPPRASMHEGWALIHEETGELWTEVQRYDTDRALAEAIQVAGSALRFIHDIRALTSPTSAKGDTNA